MCEEVNCGALSLLVTCKFIDIVYLLIHLGSDSTSAFFGKGKTRTWQVARDEEKYFEGFESLGNELDVSGQVISILEKYVCHLYGQPKISSVNEARYQMFRLGKCSEESLPPNSDSLHQHILRVNYEAFIRKQSTINTISAPSPDGYGWTVEGTDLNIKWGTMESAPDSILEYVMCRCKKGTPRGARVRKQIYNAQNYANVVNVKIWKAQKLIVILIMNWMKILMMTTINFRILTFY